MTRADPSSIVERSSQAPQAANRAGPTTTIEGDRSSPLPSNLSTDESTTDESPIDDPRAAAQSAAVPIPLLDHSMLLWGSGMSESNNHERTDLPTLLVGGFNGRGSRHIAMPPETPIANMMLALSRHYGVELESYGISTGSVDLVNG